MQTNQAGELHSVLPSTRDHLKKQPQTKSVKDQQHQKKREPQQVYAHPSFKNSQQDDKDDHSHTEIKKAG